jgi:hypothetical protein
MTFPELSARTDAFVTKWTGNHVTTDGAFPRSNPFQCWDLADQFGKEVVGNPILNTRPGGNGGAVDCYRQFINPLPNYYTRHALGTTEPRKGDNIIWNENVGSGDGHISIYLYATAGGFVSFDQNWPLGSAPKKVIHTWANVLGFIRPITQEDEPMIADVDNEFGRWNKLAYQIRGRSMSREEFRQAAVGRTWLQAMEILSDSAESDAATNAQNVGQVAIRDQWDQQIYGLQAQVGQLKTQANELAKRPTQEALSQLQSGLQNCELSIKDMSDKVAMVDSQKDVPADTPAEPSDAKPTLAPNDLISKILAWFMGRKK